MHTLDLHRFPVHLAAATTAALALLLLPGALPAQEGEPEAPPPLSLEAVIVEPPDPGADTLCRLRVKLSNQGSEIASQLGFAVMINGQELPVYRNQLFMYPAEPGADTELSLYNFWSTETSRPMPASGKLELEVVLKEAQWMKIETDDEGVEVWTPLGAVPGLPVSKKITLEMKK